MMLHIFFFFFCFFEKSEQHSSGLGGGKVEGSDKMY